MSKTYDANHLFLSVNDIGRPFVARVSFNGEPDVSWQNQGIVHVPKESIDMMAGVCETPNGTLLICDGNGSKVILLTTDIAYLNELFSTHGMAMSGPYSNRRSTTKPASSSLSNFKTKTGEISPCDAQSTSFPIIATSSSAPTLFPIQNAEPRPRSTPLPAQMIFNMLPQLFLRTLQSQLILSAYIPLL